MLKLGLMGQSSLLLPADQELCQPLLPRHVCLRVTTIAAMAVTTEPLTCKAAPVNVFQELPWCPSTAVETLTKTLSVLRFAQHV